MRCVLKRRIEPYATLAPTHPREPRPTSWDHCDHALRACPKTSPEGRSLVGHPSIMRDTPVESKRSASSRSKQRRHPMLMSAIKNWQVLSFVYKGKPRIVEPQSYGISATNKQLLRLRQTGGESDSGTINMGKLFDVAEISALRKTGAYFDEALPGHNPNDSAMIQVFASLPLGGKRTDPPRESRRGRSHPSRGAKRRQKTSSAAKSRSIYASSRSTTSRSGARAGE